MKDNRCHLCIHVGKKYSDRYVNNLFRMLRKQSDADFYVFTDDVLNNQYDEGIIPVDISRDLEEYRQWEHWWPTWYRMDIMSGKFLKQYDIKILWDLDLIIHGDISPLLEFDPEPEKLYAIYSTWRAQKEIDEDSMQKLEELPDQACVITRFNGSCMIWRTVKYIYEEFAKDPKGNVKKYRGFDVFCDYKQLPRYRLPDLFYSYRDGVYFFTRGLFFQQHPKLPVALFHQKPEIHELDPKEHPILKYWDVDSSL